MLKLTKTGIGLLTKQYKSVLRKCLLLNLGLFTTTVCIIITQSSTAFSQIAIGTGNGANAASYSVAIGVNASATNEYTIAIGPTATANASHTVAMGDYAQALSDSSTVLGTYSYASGVQSVALGNSSLAYEDYTVSVGSSSVKRRIVNVAEGIGAHDAVTVSQLGNIAAGTKILNANGENALSFGTGSGQTTVGTAISTLANQLYNYYYTFRVDERTEVIEFTKELKGSKKEMSSLDFIPIKSSSDLQINLIKAEDPLTFSAKTRNDSLVLMEVCHA